MKNISCRASSVSLPPPTWGPGGHKWDFDENPKKYFAIKETI